MGAGFAAVVVIKEKELVEHFKLQRATSVATAQSLDALRVEHNMTFRRLEDRAVIRRGAGDTYYLDEPSWNAMKSTQHRVLVVIAIIGLALIASIFYNAQKTKDSTPSAVQS